MLHGINLEVAAEWNRRLVLQLLRIHGETTRRELAAVTRLSMPAIANITGLLAEDGFIREAGRTKSGRGQPAIRLQLVENHAIFIGIDVCGTKIRLAAVNLRGQAISRNTIHLNADEEHSLTSVVAHLLASGEINAEKIIGVAVVDSSCDSITARTAGPAVIAGSAKIYGGGGNHGRLSEVTSVSRYRALATTESLAGADHERRFAYVHLGDPPALVTVTGTWSDHLHVDVLAMPKDTMPHAAALAESDPRWPIENHALEGCAVAINGALHEAYGRSIPGTLYVGGYLSDSASTGLIKALGRLRDDSVVLAASEPEYAVAVGAAMMLIERLFGPQSVLHSQWEEVADSPQSARVGLGEASLSMQETAGGEAG
jgi:hypothetical protein